MPHIKRPDGRPGIVGQVAADPETAEASTPERPSPPAFTWDEWYASVGGRSINIDEVNALLKEIHGAQYPRFDGPVASTRRELASPEDAAAHLKAKALEFGADVVGACEIELSDVYAGRTVTEKYAIAVGQRMLWDNDRYVVDTGRCSPYFAKHYYGSICLPGCVYNHKEWARDFEGVSTKLWPEIHMDEPPPTDLPEDRRHSYVQIRR